MPTVITGSRATAATQAILSTGRKPDRDVNVAQLEENAAPLLLWTKRIEGRKRQAGNPEFDWFEDEPMPYWDAVNKSGGYTAGATSVVVDNGSYFGTNDLLKFPRTGEVVRITAVSSNTLTVSRSVGSTAAAALNDDEDVRKIGSAYSEGASAGTMKSTQKTKVLNYSQIFRSTFGATGTEQASELYWGDDRQQERFERGVDHALDIEAAFLFGEKNEDTSGSTPIRTTGGVVEFISTNSTAVNGFLDMDTFDKALRDGFRYNSKKGRPMKWLFASAVVNGAINNWGRDVLQTVPLESTFGVHVKKYANAHGSVMIIEHRLLEDNPLTAGAQSAVYGGYAIGVDPQSPRYRYLKGRDTKLRRNIQANDADAWQDEYLTEAGLEFKSEKWNFLLTGVTANVP
jgi:hypothetical protein|tara:strand:+ start:5783 stop:6985 length:1203 start_codon:yes stop_codon:yes gene_type:complete